MEPLSNAMSRIKQETDLRQFCEDSLNPIGRTFECPVCHSGTGPNRTPAFTVDKDQKHWKCFSCGSGGDVFDLAGIVLGIDSRADQARAVAEWAQVEAPAEREGASATKTRDERGLERGRADHRGYIAWAQGLIGEPEPLDYLRSRGITQEDANEWGLGYDPSRRRIVIPWSGSDYYHVDRDVTGSHPHKYEKPKSDEVGPQPMWNPGALRAPAFFVVEGAIDALAVTSCGFEAVALGGRSARALTEAMEAAGTSSVAILLLDDDGEGRKGQQAAAEAMDRARVPHLVAEAKKLGTKDAGEAFARDRAALRRLLSAWYDEATAGKRDAELRLMGVYDPGEVLAGIFTMQDVLAPIPTGFSSVDEALGGGLPARGLVVIGALSSAGKTTLTLQIADSLAARGKPVLFVTIEQGRQELVAKSLSRIMGTMSRSNGKPIYATAQAITNRDERERWERDDLEKVQALVRACEIYHGQTRNADDLQTLFIMEAAEVPTVARVRSAAELAASLHGKPPVIVIDYVQLLGPAEGYERASDKQVLDRNVGDLRRLARDMNTCVIAISSLNRASYTGSIDLDSFKESGTLEYSADVLLGLQPRGIMDALRDLSEDKRKREARKIVRDFKESKIKECELVVLKNRNGRIPESSPALSFDGRTSTFSEEKGEPRTSAAPIVV